MKEDIILDAAKKLFSKYGFKKVSMDEIAKEAGFTKRTVYKYFVSKEELLKSIIDQDKQEMEDIVNKIENENKDFFETIHEILITLFEYKKNSILINILIEENENLKTKEIGKYLKEIDEEIQNSIKLKIQKANELKYIRISNPDIVAFLIYKMYIALVFDWKEELNEKAISDSILNILKYGIEGK